MSGNPEILDKKYFMGIDVYTTAVIKSSVFWDMTPCITDVSGGKYRIHLQVRIISQVRNQRESKW
jgi:hypothetical protein